MDCIHTEHTQLVTGRTVFIPVSCQNLGAASSNRVRTRQDTIDVDCCVREYKIGEKVNERLTLFVFPPHLLVIIGYI